MKRKYFPKLPSLTRSVFTGRDVYHNIEPLDPEKLNVFRTVREITGERRQEYKCSRTRVDFY